MTKNLNLISSLSISWNLLLLNNILFRGIQKQLESNIILTFIHLILVKLVKEWKMQIMEDSKVYFR